MEPSNEHTRVIHSKDKFRDIETATLEWRVLTGTHQYLSFLASGLPGGLAVVNFVETEYVCGPVAMHNVHLRAATPEETEALRRKLPQSKATRLQSDDHLVIECDEAICQIWAGAMGIVHVGEEDIDLQHQMSGPLWEGGPPLGEL